MHIKNSETAAVGLVLGIVWLIIGFNYGNTALLILGGIMLSLGLFYNFKKESVQKVSNKIQKRDIE